MGVVLRLPWPDCVRCPVGRTEPVSRMCTFVQFDTWEVAPGLHGVSMEYLNLADGWVPATHLAPKFGLRTPDLPGPLNRAQWSLVYTAAERALTAGHGCDGHYVHGDIRLNNIMVRCLGAEAAGTSARNSMRPSRKVSLPKVPTARPGLEAKPLARPLTFFKPPDTDGAAATNESAAEPLHKSQRSSDLAPSSHAPPAALSSQQQLRSMPPAELPSSSTFHIKFIDFDWAGQEGVSRCAAPACNSCVGADHTATIAVQQDTMALQASCNGPSRQKCIDELSHLRDWPCQVPHYNG